jgi:hypothetical protein
MAFTNINSEKAPNVLTGYTSGAGTVASTDSVLQAIQKLNGNYVAGVNTARPAFLAKPTTDQTDIALESNVVVVFGTEIFDYGNNFANNVFTAPVTGIYCLTFSFWVDYWDTGASFYYPNIVTSNRSYGHYMSTKMLPADDAMCFTFTIAAADMDANDTAYCVIKQMGGIQQTHIFAANGTFFAGHLVC